MRTRPPQGSGGRVSREWARTDVCRLVSDGQRRHLQGKLLGLGPVREIRIGFRQAPLELFQCLAGLVALLQREVTLGLYNKLGQKMETLYEGHAAGKHVIEFDGAKYASGVYFAKLTSQEEAVTSKVVLVR